MKIFFIVSSLIAALFLEWSSANFLSIFDVAPPLLSTTLFFWFWRIGYYDRIWFALACGIILDSFSIFIFGTYTLILLFLALVAEYLKFLFFSQESRLIQTISTGFFVFLFLTLPKLPELWMNYDPSSISAAPSSQINIVIASFVWSILLPLGMLIILRVLRR